MSWRYPFFLGPIPLNRCLAPIGKVGGTDCGTDCDYSESVGHWSDYGAAADLRFACLLKKGGVDFLANISSLPSRTRQLLLIFCALQFRNSLEILLVPANERSRMGRDHGQATPEIEEGQSWPAACKQQGSQGQTQEDPHLIGLRNYHLGGVLELFQRLLPVVLELPLRRCLEGFARSLPGCCLSHEVSWDGR